MIGFVFLKTSSNTHLIHPNYYGDTPTIYLIVILSNNFSFEPVCISECCILTFNPLSCRLLSGQFLPGSAQTQRRIDVAGSGGGTWAGWCPGSSGCCHPVAHSRRPPTPRPPPAETSCPLDTSDGRCHSGSGCSEQLSGSEDIELSKQKVIGDIMF